MAQTFKLKSSRLLAAALIAVHLVAIMALIPLALPLWSKVALMLLVAADFAYLLWRDILLALPSSCIGLALEQEGVGILARNGERLPCKVLHSLVTPAITVLNVLPQGARFARSTVILPDALDAESFRQLRVWLKWGSN